MQLSTLELYVKRLYSEMLYNQLLYELLLYMQLEYPQQLYTSLLYVRWLHFSCYTGPWYTQRFYKWAAVQASATFDCTIPIAQPSRLHLSTGIAKLHYNYNGQGSFWYFVKRLKNNLLALAYATSIGILIFFTLFIASFTIADGFLMWSDNKCIILGKSYGYAGHRFIMDDLPVL